MNEKTIQRWCGKKISYNDEIQLKHHDSGFFIKTDKTCADVDKSSNRLYLSTMGGKDVQFMIEPRYKYRIRGMQIIYGDMVTFMSMKKGNQQIHVSNYKALMPSENYQDPGFEEAIKILQQQ